MKYKEAMAIGSEVDGVIKCTWAIIYDAAGHRIYSVQKKGTWGVPAVAANGTKEDFVLDIMTSDSEIDESICSCKRFVDGYRVPVQLHANVLGMLKNSYSIAKDHLESDPENERWKLRVENLEKQIADIEAGKEFWVKVKAFEWYPLNDHNVGSEVRKAESDLKKAKLILGAAAAVTVA